jgi:hypothetical protein
MAKELTLREQEEHNACELADRLGLTLMCVNPGQPSEFWEVWGVDECLLSDLPFHGVGSWLRQQAGLPT